jgi:hypothetical protein
MGIDHDSKLIIGFSLDEDKLKKWMDKHDIEDPYDINKIIREMYPELPEKSLSLYVVHAGNAYSDCNEYYLTFFECGTNIGEIKKITPNHLELAKKVYKDLMKEDLECKSVEDIEVYSVNYTW